MTTKLVLSDLLPKTVDFYPTHPVLGKLSFAFRLQGPQAAAVRQKGIETLAWLNTVERNKNPTEVATLLEKVERLAGEAAAAAITGWDDEATTIFGPFTPERAKELLTSDDFSWLREQVNNFVKDQQNFFRAAPARAGDAGEVAS